MAFLVAQTVNNLAACRRPRFDPWVRKFHWRKKLQPTPVFLPAESHGQKSLAGYSPWGCQEFDTTEWLTLLLSYIYNYILSSPESTLTVFCVLINCGHLSPLGIQIPGQSLPPRPHALLQIWPICLQQDWASGVCVSAQTCLFPSLAHEVLRAGGLGGRVTGSLNTPTQEHWDTRMHSALQQPLLLFMEFTTCQSHAQHSTCIVPDNLTTILQNRHCDSQLTDEETELKTLNIKYQSQSL